MSDSSSAQVLKSAKYVSLITFRKSGEPVRSPVWFAQFGKNPNSYGVITETNAGKVKRIRTNSKIEIQVCDIKGGVEPDAQKFSGVAHLVNGAEAVAVRKAISKRYGLTYKLFSIYYSVSSLFKKKDELPETNIVFELNN
ncbi:MAG: PPOX class F420-dependent oxidoreductase [Ilumatobacteraceae bacterium]